LREGATSSPLLVLGDPGAFRYIGAMRRWCQSETRSAIHEYRI